MMPGASRAQLDTFGEWQRKTCSANVRPVILNATANFDVLELLPQFKAPTLVMHVRDDAQIPLEAGAARGGRHSGCEFVVLQGKNHILLEQDAATPTLLRGDQSCF